MVWTNRAARIGRPHPDFPGPDVMSRGQLKLFGKRSPGARDRDRGFPRRADRAGEALRFPDTEVSFQIDENIRGTTSSSCSRPGAGIDQLIELCVMIDAFRRSSASRITAVIPYYGYARQDCRTNRASRSRPSWWSIRWSAAGANRVLTMDLHKAQIQGFFDIPVDHLLARR